MGNNSLQLTEEQNEIAAAMTDYARNGTEPYIAVAGYAGTGKTTVMGYAGAKMIENNPNISIAWCAPTGKAASVLKSKLEDFGALNTASEVNTVHGHIYRLSKAGRRGDLVFNRKSGEVFAYDLVVVDEASMITRTMFSDLLSFGKKLIFIGDSGQLPPVGDVAFAPLINTDLVLKKVHRQALKNPITAMATEVRNGGFIPYGCRGAEFCKIHRQSPAFQQIFRQFADKIKDGETMILCGRNNTRIQLNRTLNVYNVKTPSDWDCACGKRKPGFGVVAAKKVLDKPDFMAELSRLGFLENYKRNRALIDMQCLPVSWRDKIRESYKSAMPAKPDIGIIASYYGWQPPGFDAERTDCELAFAADGGNFETPADIPASQEEALEFSL